MNYHSNKLREHQKKKKTINYDYYGREINNDYNYLINIPFPSFLKKQDITEKKEINKKSINYLLED